MLTWFLAAVACTPTGLRLHGGQDPVMRRGRCFFSDAAGWQLASRVFALHAAMVEQRRTGSFLHISEQGSIDWCGKKDCLLFVQPCSAAGMSAPGAVSCGGAAEDWQLAAQWLIHGPAPTSEQGSVGWDGKKEWSLCAQVV